MEVSLDAHACLLCGHPLLLSFFQQPEGTKRPPSLAFCRPFLVFVLVPAPVVRETARWLKRWCQLKRYSPRAGDVGPALFYFRKKTDAVPSKVNTLIATDK